MRSSRWIPRLKLVIRLMLVAGVLPLSACSDPDAGTIKPPPRDAMQPGQPQPESTDAASKKINPRAELKTMTPGGKKITGG